MLIFRISYHFEGQKFGTQNSVLELEVNPNDLDHTSMLPATILRNFSTISHGPLICNLLVYPENPKNNPALLLI